MTKFNSRSTCRDPACGVKKSLRQTSQEVFEAKRANRTNVRMNRKREEREEAKERRRKKERKKRERKNPHKLRSHRHCGEEQYQTIHMHHIPIKPYTHTPYTENGGEYVFTYFLGAASRKKNKSPNSCCCKPHDPHASCRGLLRVHVWRLLCCA